MHTEYRFKLDEAYLSESLRRYRRSHSTRVLRWVMKGIGFVGLGLLAVVGVFAKSAAMVSLFVFFILLLAVSPMLDVWWMKRRFRKSPFYGNNVSVRVSEAGYYSEDRQSRSELSWSAFSGGSRLSDGFLLSTAPQLHYWLPDRALVSGSIEDVQQTLQQGIDNFQRA